MITFNGHWDAFYPGVSNDIILLFLFYVFVKKLDILITEFTYSLYDNNCMIHLEKKSEQGLEECSTTQQFQNYSALIWVMESLDPAKVKCESIISYITRILS